MANPSSKVILQDGDCKHVEQQENERNIETVAVVGVGGVGGYFGARLAASGLCRLHFIARGATLQALAQRGLKVESKLQGVPPLPFIKITKTMLCCSQKQVFSSILFFVLSR